MKCEAHEGNKNKWVKEKLLVTFIVLGRRKNTKRKKKMKLVKKIFEPGCIVFVIIGKSNKHVHDFSSS